MYDCDNIFTGKRLSIRRMNIVSVCVCVFACLWCGVLCCCTVWCVNSVIGRECLDSGEYKVVLYVSEVGGICWC